MSYSTAQLLIPGYGNVLVAPQGTKAPTVAEIEKWISDGAEGALSGHEAAGFTSLDSLPTLETETEGGESKGAWEKRDIRTTAVTQTDTLTVNYVQASEEVLKARFGDAVLDKKTGTFVAPDTYKPVTRSILLIVREGTEFICFHFPTATSKPSESLEFDTEDFLKYPVAYAIMQSVGTYKQALISNFFVEKTSGDIGTPDEE